MFTLEETKAAVDEVVKEYGEDYIYPGSLKTDAGMCRYRHPSSGNPLCIVGVAVSRMLPDVDFVEEQGPHFTDAIVLNYEWEAVEYLCDLQAWQDTDWPWGSARKFVNAGFSNRKTIYQYDKPIDVAFVNARFNRLTKA